MKQVKFSPSGPLKGKVRVPGDKSISHRSLMFGALAVGETTVQGLLQGEDVLSTAAAMRAMGAEIERDANGIWHIHGVGVGGLLQPQSALDMGNSGTSTRLLMGLCASHNITTTFVGDASLSKRPMERVMTPLAQMGAQFTPSPGGRLPLMVQGACPAIPTTYRLPVASAQVKSAVLLAGLNAPGITRVIESIPTRDHSERMLRGFGAMLAVEADKDGARIISIHGESELQPQHIIVPGDPSSAAFPMVAALIVPGSDIVIENVGLNPTRAGLVHLLKEMGGQIDLLDSREVGGEPVADLHVRHSVLKGIDVPPDIAPSMIDEFPIFFVAAACADGETRTSGLDELRIKESDRLALMASGLARLGVKVRETHDGLEIEGRAGELLSGGSESPVIDAELDHRIAMSFAIAGLVTQHGVVISDMSPVATSFPGFQAMLSGLCA